MILDAELKQQLKQYIELLESDITIKICVGNDGVSNDIVTLANELSSMSSKISVERAELDKKPSFSVNKKGEDTGIVFAGVPLGQEFTSLVLALLQVSGYPPKIEKSLIEQIKNIKGEYNFVTYVSLSCHNCPEVVQALNTMSVLNPGIRHTMIDGGVFKEEVENKGIMSVPAIYLNGEYMESGRMSIKEILNRMGQTIDVSKFNHKEPFDILVIGGGPAGASAAIYAARKGIRTGIVTEIFGGQILDAVGIENLISLPYIEGPELAKNILDIVNKYDIDVIDKQYVQDIRRNSILEVKLENGFLLKSKTIILATGARWKNIHVPGEAEFKNKGVSYCPHCDGPLFSGKDVAVIGGGNTGIESAIDLAGIVKHVIVVEFLPELKADKVLQDRLYNLPNVTVLKDAQTTEITGTKKVDGITYINGNTGTENHINLQGVFVQIGLLPNTDWVSKKIEKNSMGEIIVDANGATTMEGVYAAGDCTDSSFKQIIISMGSGATAALGAFEYLIRS